MNTIQVEPGPFYFKSYGSVIGAARDIVELERELERLIRENPGAVEYHLREGHIVQWLNCLNEGELALELKGEYGVYRARTKVAAYLDRRKTRSSGKASMRVPTHHHGGQTFQVSP